jgi:methyltransferase family protein
MVNRRSGESSIREGSPVDGCRCVNELGLLDRNYSAVTLAKALARKVRRRLFGPPNEIEAAFRFGYLIFDRPDLDGGGSGFGQDYVRVLRETGLNKCDRLFEFCSGPGYIGYSLLARGFCKNLTLADVNPVAVQAAQKTADYNGIADRATVYLSDGLEQIPNSEKWDLVVGNPPHFLEWSKELRCEDQGWQLHKRFYSQVKRFLNPGAQVLLQENELGSNAEVFAPMIEEGGGEHIQTLPGPNIGPGGKMYYILSRWD